ncbi:hypothetical protein ACFSEO_08970 [Agromyces cerinus subsp. nitratus]|uniref:hypothetical protein n=1 Tax=Agromyces cerinus TaxID=33878 RepID=UPI00364340D3
MRKLWSDAQYPRYGMKSTPRSGAAGIGAPAAGATRARYGRAFAQHQSHWPPTWAASTS